MHRAYLIPKTNAELNQVVSILHGSGYDGVFDHNGAVGQKIYVWFNIKHAHLKAYNDYAMPEIRPNELYALIHKVK